MHLKWKVTYDENFEKVFFFQNESEHLKNAFERVNYVR